MRLLCHPSCHALEELTISHQTTTEVLTRPEEFDALADEWSDLHERVGAGPFQTHAWLASWARHHVAPGDLRLVLVRRDGALVGGLPAHRERRWGWPVMASLGGAVTDVTDVLVDGGPEVWAALGRAVHELRDWVVLDLPEVPPDAAARAWPSLWPGRVSTRPASPCLEFPAAPVAEVVGRLPGRTANTLRRKLRKADALGIRVERVAPADVSAALGRFVALHEAQWRGRGGVPEHLTERFRAFLTDALTRMTADGAAVVHEFHLDDEVVMSVIDVVGPDHVGYYLAGISPALRSRVDTSVLVVANDLRLATELGRPRYSMLRGDEDYKSRWRPERRSSDRILLHRSWPAGALGYTGALWLRDRLSEVGPAAADRVARLRSRVTAGG